MRLQERGRVVQKDPRGAELRQAPSRIDERLVLAGAVEQAGLELAAGADDRLGRLAEVVDVVQRVVQAEDVDAALGRAGDEPPGEVAADRPGADEEPAAEREGERRRGPRLQGADPLPRALDPAADGAVEDAAAGDFEVGETGPVQELGQAEKIRRRHQAGERLLAEDADRRVDEARHESGPYRERRFSLGWGRCTCPSLLAKRRAERVSPLRVEATSGCGLKDVAYPGHARPVPMKGSRTCPACAWRSAR